MSKSDHESMRMALKLLKEARKIIKADASKRYMHADYLKRAGDFIASAENPTSTQASAPANVPADLLDMLRKLNGLEPYNTPTNYLYGDGYFAASIQQKYSLEQINQAADALGIQRWRK